MRKAKNPKEKPLCICEYCDKVWCSPSSLEIHRRVHTGERPFPCNLCSHSATTKGSLQLHIQSHLQEKRFKCPEPLCNYSAVQSGDLKTHRVVHTREKPFSCPFPLCSSKFGQKFNLTAHLKTHEENRAKPFQCELCPFKAPTQSQIKSHKSQVHSSERKFKCEEEGCGYAGKTKTNLKIHLQTHEEKRLSCPHPSCGYKTNVKSVLKVHMKIHIHSEDKDKNYRCRICEYATNFSHELVRHTRTHTKEKPFKCQSPGCSFEAVAKSAVNSHVRAVHQKVRPFQCSSCEYASAYKNTLKRHQIRRHSQSKFGRK